MRRYASFIARAALALVLIGLGATSCKLLESTKSEGSGQASDTTEQPSTKGDATDGATGSGSAPPAGTAPVATTSPATNKPVSGGLPPLDRSSRPVDEIKASKDADKAGDIIDEGKDYATAEKQYRRAVELDPGNVFARYNVARTLVLQDKVPEGVAVLATLATKDCALCRERILSASLNDDFTKAKQTPEFVALAKDLHKSLPAVDVAARSVVKWFLTTERPEIPDHEYIDPRSTVVIEDRTRGAKKRFAQLHGAADLVSHIKQHYPKGIYPGGPRTCAKGCCDVKGSPILGVHLKRLCFETSGTSAVHLYKITIEGDPAGSFPG
jgi:hypothetical protein